MKLHNQSINLLIEFIIGAIKETPKRSSVEVGAFFMNHGIIISNSVDGIIDYYPGDIADIALTKLNGTKGLKNALEDFLTERYFIGKDENLEDAVTHLNNILNLDGYYINEDAGEYKIRKLPKNKNKTKTDFTHSEDYTSVTKNGKTYSLTPSQRLIMQYLHEAYISGNKFLSKTHLLRKLDQDRDIITSNNKLIKIFQKNENAYQDLIIKGNKKGTYALNI